VGEVTEEVGNTLGTGVGSPTEATSRDLSSQNEKVAKLGIQNMDRPFSVRFLEVWFPLATSIGQYIPRSGRQTCCTSDSSILDVTPACND
jgi:hypothetical protein